MSVSSLIQLSIFVVLKLEKVTVMDFLVVLQLRDCLPMQGTWGLIPGLGRFHRPRGN